LELPLQIARATFRQLQHFLPHVLEAAPERVSKRIRRLALIHTQMTGNEL
jgi:hypothetical protein